MNTPNLQVGTLTWLYKFCNEFKLDYNDHLRVSEVVHTLEWTPYNLKTDLKSLLLK